MIVGFVNAANMADGMNGQLLGSILIWSWFISRYLGPELEMPYYAIFCSGLVTLAFNLKGRLFSGSAGAYAASLFLALGTVAAYRRGGALSAIEPILWFWVPVVDCLRLIVVRLLARKSPVRGDRNHIHHILLAYLPPRFALLAYLILVGAPGMAAAFTNHRQTGLVVLIPCAAFYAGLVLAHSLRRQSAVKPAPAYSRADLFFGATNDKIGPEPRVGIASADRAMTSSH